MGIVNFKIRNSQGITAEEYLDTDKSNMDIESAANEIQRRLMEEGNEDWVVKFQEATGGDKEQIAECKNIIYNILTENDIGVSGCTLKEAVDEIFRRKYGLGVIEPYWEDNSVDEVRVDPGGRLFLTRKGIHEETQIKLSRDEVYSLINRLKPFNDVGASLDLSNTTLELVRDDGSRLTAVGPPVVKNPAFALRKHGNIILSPESFIELDTFDEKTWNVLKLLVKGRLNILVCGDVNSGKTTLLRLLIGEMDKKLSVRVLDLDNELRVSEIYPDREIWELEAHSEVKANLKHLFATILRLTPDVIIVPEFRGLGEVDITIEACTRGHRGSMASTHFYSQASTWDIIRNIAMLALKEGINLPIELLMGKVAQAFNILIQTHADTKSGVRKIISIKEVYVENNEIVERPIVMWVPKGEDFWGDGEWRILNTLSENSIKSMNMFGVTDKDIDRAFSKLEVM